MKLSIRSPASGTFFLAGERRSNNHVAKRGGLGNSELSCTLSFQFGDALPQPNQSSLGRTDPTHPLLCDVEVPFRSSSALPSWLTKLRDYEAFSSRRSKAA